MHSSEPEEQESAVASLARSALRDAQQSLSRALAPDGDAGLCCAPDGREVVAIERPDVQSSRSVQALDGARLEWALRHADGHGR